MRFLKRLLGLIVVLVLVLVAVAYVLPRKITVERGVTINAPANTIFPFVNSLKENEKWSPWLDRDPDVQLTYEGPEAGVGNKLTWASDHPQVGSGSNVITASIRNERIETALDFGDMGTAVAWVTFDAQGDATLVKWGFTADMGLNPIARWMGLMMDKWVGADYENGLSRLKILVEAG